ncbi:MAG: sialidase family protein [Vicinamibacterales bacterium]
MTTQPSMMRRCGLAARVLAGVALACVAATSGVWSRTDSSAATAETLVMADPVDHLDVRAREPMVVEHPDGTLFVSGFGELVPTLWKSRDHGATWSRVNVGTEADGAIGNSDVDLAVARDGTLYFATMLFDRKTGEGMSVSVGVSKDLGGTWSWTLLSKDRFDDRPWVDVAADGTVHVIWNDGSGVCHAVSKDRGRTWSERPRIHPQGGSSYLAVGPNRHVAVRVTPGSASGNKFDEGVDLLAVSTDGGTTWQKHAAPGSREWSADTFNPESFPRWVEVIAWDARGALYSFWTNRQGLWLARSVDQGGTWTSWRVAEGDELAYFPYLIARGQGELWATWFSGRGETLKAHVARFNVSDKKPPQMITGPPFQPDSWRSNPNAPDSPIRDTAGEYLATTFLRGGGIAVVSPIQDARKQRFGFSWRRVALR